MRFYEFATVARPVLKISQQQLAQQRMIQSGVATDTGLPSDSLSSAPTSSVSAQASANQAPQPASPPKPTVKVYPRARQHQWIQKYLAANMARDAQTVKPTEMDIIKAQMRFADVQRQADRDYQQRTGLPPPDQGFEGEHKWVKRDDQRNVQRDD